MSQSEKDNDTFWKTFLNPLLKEECPGQYDPDFIKSRKRLGLQWQLLNSVLILSRIVLKKLEEQKQTLEIDKEKRARELKVELLSQMVNVPKVDRQVTDRNLQGQAHGSGTNAVPMEFRLTTEEAKQTKRMKLGETTAEVGKEKNEAEQLDKEHEANVEKVLVFASEIEKTKNKKSHQQLSASEWTMEILQNYIKRENVDVVETLFSGGDAASGSGKHDGHQFSSLKNGLITCSLQLLDNHQQHFSDNKEKGLRLWSLQFSEPLLKEQTVTFMVQEIIGAVCDLCNVRMRPEETLEGDEFPDSRVDYALVYEGVFFGIVEVKAPSTMTDKNHKAVAQLMIYLLKLQFSHNYEGMKYIGILTDGFRFVLVSLQGDKFIFESTMNMESPEIKIYKAVTWKNLFQICEYLQSVLSSFTANLPKITPESYSPY